MPTLSRAGECGPSRSGRRGHILGVQGWERCGGGVRRDPSLQLPARLVVEGCSGLNSVTPLSSAPRVKGSPYFQILGLR